MRWLKMKQQLTNRVRVLRRAHGHLVQDHALEVALLGLGQA